jgi:enoyl-CoA hydratase
VCVQSCPGVRRLDPFPPCFLPYHTNLKTKARLASGNVRLERVGAGGQIILLTLDRPRKANAYTSIMLEQFSKCMNEAMADGTVRAAVITGAGARCFCAGADLNELAGKNSVDALDLLSRTLFDAWAATPWPTIAAIQGAAIAGGLELALACDLRICDAASRFALPEASLGLLPAAGGLRRLNTAIGEPRAKQMILFGEEISGSTALEWGLVSRVSGKVIADAISLAERVAQRDRLATRLAKLALNESGSGAKQSSLEAVSQALLYHRRAESKRS